ncbi:hypothetical protein B0H13DRAFT_1888187 [Mycena leptocephala]|nr:hypothetical protein B0H13DRAFT_1888187 [Mycena leptocephala]
MPRGSKKQKARQNNFQKARNAYRPTVEEVSDEDVDHQTSDTGSNIHSQPDNHCNDHLHSTEGSDSSWDIDLGNELPDVDCEDISTETQEPDLDEEIIVAPEISEESELDAFSQFLSNAQVAAQKAEQIREKGRTRPKHYSGNAPRTLRRHKKNRKDLEQAGFLSVHDFIKAKQVEKAAKLQNTASTLDHEFDDLSGTKSVSATGSDSGDEDEPENLAVPIQGPSTELIGSRLPESS